MKIVHARGVGAASSATGTVVVIDVLRAFTSAACAFGRGARALRLVSTPEEAFAERALDPALVLVGELEGRPIAGFDFGNSPEALERADASLFAGRTLVLRSSSGTQGVVRAERARAVLLGSLLVAAATARAARALGDEVTLLAMGAPSGLGGEEDQACADLLEDLLLGRQPDPAAVLERVRASRAGQKALDPSVDWISPGDLTCALALDRFGFCMRVRREDGRLVARAEPA